MKFVKASRLLGGLLGGQRMQSGTCLLEAKAKNSVEAEGRSHGNGRSEP